MFLILNICLSCVVGHQTSVFNLRFALWKIMTHMRYDVTKIKFKNLMTDLKRSKVNQK